MVFRVNHCPSFKLAVANFDNLWCYTIVKKQFLKQVDLKTLSQESQVQVQVQGGRTSVEEELVWANGVPAAPRLHLAQHLDTKNMSHGSGGCLKRAFSCVWAFWSLCGEIAQPLVLRKWIHTSWPVRFLVRWIPKDFKWLKSLYGNANAMPN